MAAQAYPLEWPEGWPRTPEAKRVAGGRFNTTFDRARRQLHDELRLLGATNVVISSWLPLRQDGEPRSDFARRKIEDPGVAVYFTLRGKQMAMGRDAFVNVHENLRSIGLSIEGLRQMERHGGAHMMERAFEGFLQIEHLNWRSVLGFEKGARPDAATLSRRFKGLAREYHPDAGGTIELMTALNVANTEAKRELGFD